MNFFGHMSVSLWAGLCARIRNSLGQQLQHRGAIHYSQIPRKSEKLNFTEIRSAFHIFRSFDRVWTFLIVVGQAMIIIAWSEISLLDIFQKDVFHKLSSVFITVACLNFIRSLLDIILNLEAMLRWTFSDVVRNVLKGEGPHVGPTFFRFWHLFYPVANLFAGWKDMAINSSSDSDLRACICSDDYLQYAVIECYKSLKLILDEVVVDEDEKGYFSAFMNGCFFREIYFYPSLHDAYILIHSIIGAVDYHLSDGTLVQNFRMENLPTFHQKFVQLVEVLTGDGPFSTTVILQDLFEIVTRDMMVIETCELVEFKRRVKDCGWQLFDKSDELGDELIPPARAAQWIEQMRRLHLLLTVKESAPEVPTNLEARRRVTFFTNSWFMKMPCPPEVEKMTSFSVMTPYYNEETVFSKSDLENDNEDGISIIYYLQKIYPDEWDNFIERLKCTDSEQWLWSTDENIMEIRKWASLRGQTLCRTVRGMMYYRRALKLQAFLDMADESDMLKGYRAGMIAAEDANSQRSLHAQLEAVADMKFTYVATCQNYGIQKQQGDRHATEILNLMINNPSLRVAYIDEVEEDENMQKVYYSVLIKAVDNLEQEIYRIKLPGSAKIGEGKPENQNHAIIFTRGEALQTIDESG